MSMPLPFKYDEFAPDKVRAGFREDALNMLAASGRLIGTSVHGSRYYVLDGRVWGVPKEANGSIMRMDYFDFCAALRNSGDKAVYAPAFIPEPTFHLGHKK